MKILVVTHSYGPNGAAALLRWAIGHWCGRYGWEVHAVLGADAMRDWGDDLRALGATPRAEVDVTERFDCGLVNTFFDGHWVEQLATRMPVVWWVHESTGAIHGIQTPPARTIDLFARCDQVLFDSDWQREMFASFLIGLGEGRARALPCGVETPTELPPPPPRGQAGTLRLITLGSVYPRKRQPDLVRAVLAMEARFAIHCDIVGDLGYMQFWSDQERPLIGLEHPRLTWHGVVDASRKAALLAGADVGCFPSADETFGIAPMETGLLGKPVVLANLAVYRSLGWQDGVNCLMYPPGDAAALRAVLQVLADRPSMRQSLGLGARVLALQYPQMLFCERITLQMLRYAKY